MEYDLTLFKGVSVADVILVKKWVQVRRLKRDLIMKGFTHQIAMYAVIQDIETEENRYARIDVLSDTAWSEESFTRVYDFISWLKNPAKYSIWAYSDETKEAIEVMFFG